MYAAPSQQTQSPLLEQADITIPIAGSKQSFAPESNSAHLLQLQLHQDRKNAPGLASAMKHSNELSSDAMSTLGTKWKFQSKLRMSAFRGKADMSPNDPKRTVLDLGPIA